MNPEPESFSLDLQAVERQPLAAGTEQITLQTSGGPIECRLHLPQTNLIGGVVWVGGAGGGLDGPAGGLYPRLAEVIAQVGLASLRLHYRLPNDYTACVLDTLLGAVFLANLGTRRLALVGHSFGGAVVITAGALSDETVGVAALSSQTSGTDLTPQVSPRSLFLAHGTQDQVLPDWCSRYIYDHANEPKEIHLYPDCSHGLDECRDQIDADLLDWLRRIFLFTPTAPG